MSKEIKLVFAADHAGFELKEFLRNHYANRFETIDKGAYSKDSVDYPDFAHPLAMEVLKDENNRGILICGSGNGVCMAANKHDGIRAALCWEEEIAELAVLHNNANVLCLPARYLSQEKALAIVEKYINSNFEGGRHQKRVNKINLC